MPESYHLALINSIVFVVFICLFAGFRIFLPHKRIPYFLLVLLLSLPPLLSITRTGTYESGDLSIHVMGTLSFHNALSDGDLVPVWANDLVGTYGSPHHLLMYFLPRFIPSLFHFAGIPILASLKLFIALTFIFSGIFMFAFVKKLYNPESGLLAAVFYLYAPYHLVDLHFRVATGELLAFTFIPLLFICVLESLRTSQLRWYIATSFSLCCLILSHQAITYSILPLLFIFILLFSKQLRLSRISVMRLFLSLFVGVLLSAFYVLPLLVENTYTWFSRMKGLSFETFVGSLVSPYRFGLLFQGPTGQLSFVPGYVQIVIVFFFLFLVIRKRVRKRDFYSIITLLLFIFLYFFLLLPYSEPVWNTMPLMRSFQSSYRLHVPLAFLISCLSAYLYFYIRNKKFLFFILILAIVSTILNWGNRGTIPSIRDDSYFKDEMKYYLSRNNGIDFALPIWVDPTIIAMDKEPSQRISTVSGSVRFSETLRKNSHQEYILYAHEPSVVKISTFYFPGWKLYVNGDESRILLPKLRSDGLISFHVDKGLTYVLLRFEDTSIRKIGKGISISALGIILVVLLLSSMRKIRKRLSLPKI
jgi:hypothetical protein